MKPVSLRFASTCLAALLSAPLLCLAGDVIKLKTGEKLDGKILSETPTEIVIELQLGRIKEEKKVARKDITEIIKATPDQFESAELAKLLPSEDGLSDNSYQKIITDKLEPFLKKYPASLYKSQVEAILKTYQEELAKAKGGAKKIEGTWVMPAELVWNSYNIEARLKRVELLKLLKAGKVDEAGRILAELEAEKPASVETVAALEAIKAVLPDYEKTIDRLILEHPIKMKARVESNKSLTPDQRKIVEAALKKEQDELKLRLEEDRKLKAGILSFDEYDLKSLQDARTALQKEVQRVAKLELVPAKAAAITFQTGLKNFSEKAYLSAQRNFEDAAKVFPKDTFVKERVEIAKKAAAEALRAANEANAAKPAVTTDPKPGEIKPTVKPKEPAKTEGGAPVKKATPPPAEDAPNAYAETVAEDSPSSLSAFLIAGAAALIVILFIVKSLAKKKAAAADE